MSWTTSRVLVLLVSLGLIATSCRAESSTIVAERAVPTAADTTQTIETTPAEPEAEPEPGTDPPAPAAPRSDLPRSLTIVDVHCALPGEGSPTGLTSDGEALFERHASSGAEIPTYELAVDINPATGEIAGAMRAVVPAQERTINFRVFAGLPAFDSAITITNITQNGEPVSSASLDRALLSLPAASATGTSTIVELDFRYTVTPLTTSVGLAGLLAGDSLQPDQVGLLGRTETGMQLGHWFPVWLPDGIRSDADPAGFGDIGAFPASNVCATITVPDGYEVVTGGVRVDATDESVIEAGLGLRDFSLVVRNDISLTAGVVDGVEIRVWGPSDDSEALLTVLDYAVRSQRALVDAFGPYPWAEIDVVSAPLGSGVGGMEWPGMIWIERSTFAGGLPGLGDVDLDSVLGSLGGEALATTLEWTIAHELGHEWWHATVGNDSIESPAVDEPLAQLSACIAMQAIHPENWLDICMAQTLGVYSQARALGIADVPAEQASDAFDTALQYSAIIYGKAPGFYFEAAEVLGWKGLTDALKTFVEQNSFALVSTDALRTHLVRSAGTDGQAIGDLWDRWFRQAKGDEDIEPSDPFGGLDALPGLEDLDDLSIDELLEDVDLEALFGENSDQLAELLESLLNPEE